MLVGADHHEWLGPTLEDIGREKAGIFRRGRPAVLGTSRLPVSVFTEIERIGAVARTARRDFDWEIHGERWEWRSARRTLADLPRPALAGATQFGNAATAIAALDASTLAVSREAVAQGLGQVRLSRAASRSCRARSSGFSTSRTMRLRPPSSPASLGSAHPGTHAGGGQLDDKDVASIGLVLRGQVDEWVLTTLPPPRGLDAGSVVARLRLEAAPLATCASVAEACARARVGANYGDRIVVFGSFHVVGPALNGFGYTEFGVNKQFKERLTGAVILVVFVVIVVPALLPARRIRPHPRRRPVEGPPLRSYTIDLTEPAGTQPPITPMTVAPPPAPGAESAPIPAPASHTSPSAGA